MQSGASAALPFGTRANAARLSAIVLILYARNNVTGEELASKLGVTLRTVYRDVARLEGLGFPIAASPGPGGGFTLDFMSAEEGGIATERDLLDVFARTGLTAPDNATLDAVIGMAGDAITAADLQSLRNAADRILFDPEEWYRRTRPPADFGVVRHAVLNDVRLDVAFTERTGPGLIEDVFDPYGLIWKGGVWYIYGYSHRERGMRRIRVERLVRAQMSAEHFRRPKDFDLLQQWQEELESFGKGTTRVVIRIEQSVVPEFEHFNWKRENKIIRKRDHWLVEMRVDNVAWLVPLVLSYAGDVRILRPPALCDLVLAAARAVLAAHSGEHAGPSGSHTDDSRSRAAIHRRSHQE